MSGTATGSSATSAPWRRLPAGSARDRHARVRPLRGAISAPTSPSSASRCAQDLTGEGPPVHRRRSGALPRRRWRKTNFYKDWKAQVRRRGLGPSRESLRQAGVDGHGAHHRELTRPSRLRASHARCFAAAHWAALGSSAVLGRLVEIPAALLVVAEIVVLLAGVLARYVFHQPLVWSDELASILFLWLAMLGSVVAFQRGEHMRMTAIVGMLAPRARAFLDVSRSRPRSPSCCSSSTRPTSSPPTRSSSPPRRSRSQRLARRRAAGRHRADDRRRASCGCSRSATGG